jgi:histidinol-phosphatase
MVFTVKKPAATRWMPSAFGWSIRSSGTKSFVRECPSLRRRSPCCATVGSVLGVSSAPAYGELAWAERGGGAFLLRRANRFASVRSLLRSVMRSSRRAISKTLAPGRVGHASANSLRARIGIRGYGDFAHYHLLARGALDAVIESDVNISDIAASHGDRRRGGRPLLPISMAGPVTLETTGVLATNGALHAALHAQLG